MRDAARWAAVPVLAVGLGACAPKTPSLPAGAGQPFPSFAAAYAAATATCSGVRTYTGVMALSGKAGTTKLRGRIEAGFAAPGRVRLEGIAPFGRPVFVLTADGERGTLVLPREDQVLQNVGPDQIVDALAGVPLGADALRTVVSGCGLLGDETPTEGRAYPGGQVAVVFRDGTAYLRQAGETWTLTASVQGSVTVFYSDIANGRPSTVRVRVGSDGRVTSDLTLRLSDVELNTPIAPQAFTPVLPDHPVAITLEDLRRAGPLGDGGR